MVVNWVSSCLSFFLSASTAAAYIFTAPTCTTTLEPCALNAEFNEISLLCGYHWKRGLGVKALPQRGWRQGDFMDNSNVYNLSPLVGSQKGWIGKQDSSIQWTEKVTPNLHFSPNSKQWTQKESCSKSTFSLNSTAYRRTAMIINWYQAGTTRDTMGLIGRNTL